MATRQKIILVSLFYYETSDNIRISTIYRLLKEKGADIELITTDFNHRKKQKHDPSKHPEEITFLPVPEYKKNVGFGRLYSHLIFAFRLRSYLKKLAYRPSKLYCLVPAVSAGWACAGYCKKANIPLVIDVIDLWPESFLVLNRHKRLMQWFTFPWKKLAEKVYSSADYLFAGSKKYAEYAQKFNRKTHAVPVYLGTDVSHFHSLIAQSKLKIDKAADQKWICFGGMLGNSYDIDIILESFKTISEKKKHDLRLVFIGGGQEADKILDFKKKHSLNIVVTGFLDYADYMKYLSYADMALNSFKAGSEVAYSYKFNDYLTAGVPVLNNLKGETADLITRYRIGLNFEHNVHSLTTQINKMLETPGLLPEMRKNATFVASSILDKQHVYRPMLKTFME